MQSSFFFTLVPDESRVLCGNPAEVTDCDLTRGGGVSVGEKSAKQQQQPEQQEH